jgi:hypothetical protein
MNRDWLILKSFFRAGQGGGEVGVYHMGGVYTKGGSDIGLNYKGLL